MARRSPGVRELRTSWWTVAAVTGLVIIDVVLVWSAVSSVQSAAANAVQYRSAPPVGATPAPSAVPAIEPDFTVEPLSRVLAVGDGGIAYRSITGGCPAEPAQLERTADGGVSWLATSPTETVSIQQILVEGEDVVAVVAAHADDCAPMISRSGSQGAEWEPADELGIHWYLAAGQVVAPGGVASTPCATPVQLAPRDDASAAVLCSDATVAATTDAGSTWGASEQIDGASSITRSDDGYRVAVTGVNGCDGAQVVPVSTALAVGASGSCMESGATDGATVLATGSDGMVWIWSGETLAHSSNGGTTW